MIPHILNKAHAKILWPNCEADRQINNCTYQPKITDLDHKLIMFSISDTQLERLKHSSIKILGASDRNYWPQWVPCLATFTCTHVHIIMMETCSALDLTNPFFLTRKNSSGSLRNTTKRLPNHQHFDGSLPSFSFETITLNQKPHTLDP